MQDASCCRGWKAGRGDCEAGAFFFNVCCTLRAVCVGGACVVVDSARPTPCFSPSSRPPSLCHHQDPFAERTTYNDNAVDRFFIKLYSQKMADQLDGEGEREREMWRQGRGGETKGS